MCGITFGWIVRNAEIDGVRRLAVVGDVVVAAPETRAGSRAVVGGSKGAGTDGVGEFVDAAGCERAERTLLRQFADGVRESGTRVAEGINDRLAGIE